MLNISVTADAAYRMVQLTMAANIEEAGETNNSRLQILYGSSSHTLQLCLRPLQTLHAEEE